MIKQRRTASICLLAAVLFLGGRIDACTSLLVTKGASADGSVMITYTCDGEFHPHLEYTPAADHKPGDSVEIKDWGGSIRGMVAQAEHTHAVVHLMNEHQLVVGETTFDGRKELKNPDGLLHYWDLMTLALERARTAREAIQVMTDLVAEYGYRSTGESISIADPDEAWILEIIGPGPGGTGAEWVAVKVPDGYISAHANKARIGEFPLDDPDNCLYSDNVISFAVEKGYYDPTSGEPFRYCDAYCPETPENLRFCEARVWSLFRRAAPSENFSPAYHRAVKGAEPYPLWIKPDKKLSLSDVFDLMRDHYEGTEFDLTKNVDAGPYGSPYRWRPLKWTVDSVQYGWERAISTQQTGFSFVSQSRSWLPDPVGGVLWYGVDDTYMTCYVPLYCGIDTVPRPYTVGELGEFSWESAWWVFNFVSNFANLAYSFMMPEIQAVQSELEDVCIIEQPVIDETALKLYKSDPGRAAVYLTNYSVGQGERVVRRWRELGERLITEYNDGYMKNEEGRPKDKGYPECWLKEVIKDNPDKYHLPQADSLTADWKLID
ncbi:MAG: C69 family dipeptidase [Candidatus Zixiibacteriota bacterium]|nr:MAG: C69 family dipeptidase [candidate division Zixibacteria bacterium]